MEGCSKYCSFCVVPYTRGDEVSRKPEQIFDEVARLAEQGVSEITFIGQNVNSYKMPYKDRILRLSDLIEIVSHIDGVERIRYTTSHPLDMTDDLIEVYQYVPQLVSQLHLPVQSGSNRILEKMKRNYTIDIFLDAVEKIKSFRPDLRVSSDFIVGFPGETADDFQKTLDLVNEVKFDSSFSFIYSKRPGTPASKLEDNTSADEKKERLKTLQDQLNLYHREHSNSMIGSIQRCLVTGLAKRSPEQLQARTECNRVINFDLENIRFIGKLVDIEVTEALSYSLLGTLHNPRGKN
jgi:tRNA-2-methylthio-N6-dimethylallyladenosine synthase